MLFVKKKDNLITKLDGNLTNNSLVRAYTWGLDASGSMQGAGGVGGLLMVNAGTNGVHFPAYDLNGNVMGLVNAANGIISAKYEYGPFGEVFCSVGDMARVNPFQFSTKYTDNETDLVYYGYRYYSPALGRWLSRDPIEEQGGLNLYAFVNNDPVNGVDVLGKQGLPFPNSDKIYIPTPANPVLVEFQSQTYAVKNHTDIRHAVKLLINNMESEGLTNCFKSNSKLKKDFKSQKMSQTAFMYNTKFFYLGNVSVNLQGDGFYEIDCCNKKYINYTINISGDFQDKFDELISVGYWFDYIKEGFFKKGYGSLPITFVGHWIEYHTLY
jgi:RHS repeat-associated protein